MVVERHGHAGREITWKCQCDCGKIVYTTGHVMKSGSSRSCGCLFREVVEKNNKIHGETGTRLYNNWKGMLQRCRDKNYAYYNDYGGRGIKVCDQWKQFVPFRNWALANGYKDGLTIERVDNNGNYEPENCKWVTRKEQGNNRRTNHLITFNGKTQNIAQWSEETGLPFQLIIERINILKWTPQKALTTPARRHKPYEFKPLK